VLADLLTVGNAVATVFLTGLSWTIAVVVYPGFAEVGPTAAWSRFHDAHSRRISYVVGLPWAVQGVTGIGLLFDRPAGVPLWLVLLAGVAAAATVATTVVGAVPVHERLGHGFDPALLRSLLRWHWLRTVAWTLSAGCGVAILQLAQT
jgi:hypothetical protein